jgi:hypothetical protein
MKSHLEKVNDFLRVVDIIREKKGWVIMIEECIFDFN